MSRMLCVWLYLQQMCNPTIIISSIVIMVSSTPGSPQFYQHYQNPYSHQGCFSSPYRSYARGRCMDVWTCTRMGGSLFYGSDCPYAWGTPEVQCCVRHVAQQRYPTVPSAPRRQSPIALLPMRSTSRPKLKTTKVPVSITEVVTEVLVTKQELPTTTKSAVRATTPSPTFREDESLWTVDTGGSHKNLRVDGTHSKTVCGEAPLAVQGRVVGGDDSNFGHWPWQISIRTTRGKGSDDGEHKCGGVLLTESWVVTTAHSITPYPRERLIVRAGDHDQNSTSEPLNHQDRHVEKLVLHPDYQRQTYDNDIALLKTKTPFKMALNVQAVCLYEYQPLPGKGILTGWGQTKENGSSASVLQEVSVPLIGHRECSRRFHNAGHKESLTERVFCAGYLRGGKDACQGDSGGPLVAQGNDGRWRLVGIVSWGIGCGRRGLPGVFTKISTYVPWIKNTTSTNASQDVVTKLGSS
ncbi:serine proteinase stubble-like [Ornithodoros turicata]|uniref:serine proteinase stubble-like n=1 Tax=Ornithodoros turicata TaxID=34597 RepID=UPI0031387703